MKRSMLQAECDYLAYRQLCTFVGTTGEPSEEQFDEVSRRYGCNAKKVWASWQVKK